MSDNPANVYSYCGALSDNNGATAAAIDILNHACAAAHDSRSKQSLLEWASRGDNLKNLRDKIKEAAS
ncbi:hypothetical protein IDSA_11450 [Pseudidiomarina salinarum]|uniref:Uncharacterized protein n=1 Tax=Pseudidiomarina salinarum TaxID=435908 RepID=A0A094IR59_9GAMM|nr:hypothetical protein [Pseudidiomarina salinarum]KFZ30170.1 hypothetical protein IDSA_11450 [Pseudidiomarina salinarum]RUO68671.1 hypothetical protein CWI79_11430 [Pseudidiomarina salinarum]